MKTKKDVTRTYTTKEVAIVKCDICSLENDKQWGYGYNKQEVEISLTEGDVYPEGGSEEISSFDICPNCFKTVFIPLMKKTFGIDPQIEYKDW